jgi:hypothetical protein
MIEETEVYGTWRLVKGTTKDPSGNLRPPPYGGSSAMALLALRKDGRMVSVLCDSRSEMPGTGEREYTSYCGTFSFDGSTLVTRVDACSDPNRFGTDQIRKVRMEGKLLVLEPPPREKDGILEYREMFWERIGDA